MNYNNKKFRSVANSDNGELGMDTIFHYEQNGNVLTCTYEGDGIVCGHLLGKVDAMGNIEMRYHQLNENGQLMTGICHSAPEIMDNGKIRLHENWQWTSGDLSIGHSVLEEV